MISMGGSFFSVWRMVRFATILPKSAERREPPAHTCRKKRTSKHSTTASYGDTPCVPPNVDEGMTVDAEIKVVGLGIYE